MTASKEGVNPKGNSSPRKGTSSKILLDPGKGTPLNGGILPIGLIGFTLAHYSNSIENGNPYYT